MDWDKFLDHVQFDLGDGNHERFLDLYAIAADIEASIASYSECHNGRSTRVWNIKFFRELNYWELESVLFV